MSKGKPNVFIIESLDLEDEKDELFEGRILSQVLHLGAKESFYYHIRTRSELKRILGEFDRGLVSGTCISRVMETRPLFPRL